MAQAIPSPRDGKFLKPSHTAAVAAHAAFSIEEFCEAYRISRALFYLLVRDGQGPAFFKARRRTLISREAAEAWCRRMESNTAGTAS